MHDQPRGGGAFLPGATEGRVGGMGDGQVEIASSMTTIGFLDPISICSFGHVGDGRGAMPRPTGTEPVKLIASTPGLSTSALADSRPGPGPG
jgi:hypothetical protein